MPKREKQKRSAENGQNEFRSNVFQTTFSIKQV